MALPGVSKLVRFREGEAVKETERVGIPSHHIKVARHIMVIEFGEEPHVIVHHIAPR